MDLQTSDVMEEIQKRINEQDYMGAKVHMEAWKATGQPYSDTTAVLDAAICEALGDQTGMFDAIRKGLLYACDNYELYYMLGYYYLDANPDQAFLCFQNALFYCQEENDRLTIAGDMEELRRSGRVAVNDTVIIIVSYNACYMMQKNIESIRQSLPKGTYHIVVVDNASDDGVTKWLEKQEDIILLKNLENVGFPGACNQGVASTKGTEMEKDDVFLLNNDTRLAPNALFWLKMGLYEKDDIGATGSYANYAGNNQQIEIDFPLPTDYLNYGKKVNIPEENPYEERVRLSGFAMLVKRKVWNLTGGFDIDFTPGYFEDDDLSMKILQSGYRLLLCRNSFIYHAGSQSFVKRADIEELLTEHYTLFMEKYRFDILECAYPDTVNISAIPFSREEEFSLLQFGSRLGADLKQIRRIFPKAHVMGIEPADALYRIAKETDVVFPRVSALWEIINQPIFQVLFINPREYERISKDELLLLRAMCRPDCVILPGMRLSKD